ncbi:glyoxalase superfamily protein [Sulfitobacter sp. F26204]|uniref:glyoxalase superfamily protein n=1 Tax=Sulfitobacter sp. F26204 TaxID=2996014 RepID=UPI00225E3288|nr:glyoxalase superfamily protein [Sulfitobacter sp. F26204]MCX7558540.1 glyoxalase superfamily protein [Sulfitobacter sp. F26204]
MTDQSMGLPATPAIAKAQAKRLRTALAPNYAIGHGQALELIARVHGEPDWGRLNSLIGNSKSILAPIDANMTSGAEPADTTPKSLPGNHVEQRVLQALWSGLERAKNTKVNAKTLAKAKTLLKDEIISTIALEEYLDTLDVDLGGMIFDMGSEGILKISKVKTVSRFHRPGARETSVTGFQGLRPAAFGAVLVWLERLGFDTHPEAFYEPLLEGIKKKKFVDSEELTCFWHAKEKKPFQTSEHFVDAKTRMANVVHESVNGRNGLTLYVARSTDPLGLIESLRIHR